MYALISVTRLELEICESFYETKKEAVDAMVEDIIISTGYESLEEIIDAADSGECGFSDDEAWAETNQFGTGQWKIVEIPTRSKVDDHKLVVGAVYKMSGTDVVCIGFTKKGYAKMQTLGMTSGSWPGKSDISDYDDTTSKFAAEWEGVIKKFKLPTKKQAKKNELVINALAKAARNYSSLGAGNYRAWLGTPSGSGNAYGVGSNGYVYHSYTSFSYVCAPLFNLDGSKIILDGDEIKKI